MKHVSTKYYGHDRGLSCCFRQWRATSHCNKLHGYALAFEFIFESDVLDGNNWVVDFGDLKWLKAWLEDQFDHTTLVDASDPLFPIFQQMDDANLIDMRIMLDGVGCEKVSEFVFKHVSVNLEARYFDVKLRSVQVWEHEGNSARYEG